MEKAKKKVKRTTFLIYPKFQLTLVGVNIIVIFMIGLLGEIEAARSFNQINGIGAMASLGNQNVYLQALEFQEQILSRNLALGFLSGSILSIILTLFVSHKLAGPLVRLRNYFTELAEKNSTVVPLKFRKGDFFSELPAVINKAIENIQNGDRKKTTSTSAE